MIVRLTLAASLAGVIVCGPVLADTQRIATKRGKPTEIAVSNDIDPATCKSANGDKNQFIVLTLPQNGSVATKLKDLAYKAVGTASPCDGKRYLAPVLLYTSKRGFQGVDSFSIGYAVTLKDLEMVTPVAIEVEVQ
jgi:hypothetical protein